MMQAILALSEDQDARLVCDRDTLEDVSDAENYIINSVASFVEYAGARIRNAGQAFDT